VLFAQSAEKIRLAIHVVAGIQAPAITIWKKGRRSIGQPIEVHLTAIRSKDISGEPRKRNDDPDDATVARFWHYTREYTVLVQVMSIAPPNDNVSAFEIAERIVTRLNNNAMLNLLGNSVKFVGSGDIIPFDYTADNRVVDSASFEATFRVAGVDTVGAEDEGEIRSIDITSHLDRPDETEVEPPLGWDAHVITKP
jgi:hypothetical protein